MNLDDVKKAKKQYDKTWLKLRKLEERLEKKEKNDITTTEQQKLDKALEAWQIADKNYWECMDKVYPEITSKDVIEFIPLKFDELNIKRLYHNAHLKVKCPTCGAIITRFRRDYFSYPPIGTPIKEELWCESCDSKANAEEYDGHKINIVINITISFVPKETSNDNSK